MIGPLGHRDDLVARFWSHVDTSGSCWVWKGYVDDAGHARVSRERGASTARRYAWIITNGKPPSNKQVRDTCGNRLCVNPKHLRLGRDKIHISSNRAT